MTAKSTGNQKEWHVVYTRSRAEKKVNDELTHQNIECYLPLQKKLRQWKDRKKWVEFPLMSGYCFVNISRREYDFVLQSDNVVCYVTFEGKAAVIPGYQIEALRKMTKQYDFEVNVTTEKFEPGQTVEIIAGPMIGLRGELVKARGKNKFIIRLEQLKSAVSIEIPAEHLTALPIEM
ncbi:MAG: UpxY family transcription antiterminator [Draconibacterium sp.]